MTLPVGWQRTAAQVPGTRYLGDLTPQEVIDRLWLVAQDRALDDGTQYAYIRAGIELIEVLRRG